MAITKDQIIGALPTLSQSDLSAIKALTGVLLEPGPPKAANGPNNPQAALFGAMQGVLGVRYGPPCKVFIKNAPDFLAFISINFGSNADRRVHTALLNLLAGLTTSLSPSRRPN